MNINEFHPLQEWLDTLPEPATLYEKLLCWWSNVIDDISILKWKVKMRVKRGKDKWWKVYKYAGDGAYYARCKCGWYYACGSILSEERDPDKWKMYSYCPRCGARKKLYNIEPIKSDKEFPWM